MPPSAGHDSVSGVRAARSCRHLSSHPDLLPAVALQAKATRRTTAMTTPTAVVPPVLVLDNVEVTYKRAITAVQGISIKVSAGQIVAILGTNGAGKSTTLRAISGFLGLDDARVTEGAIRFEGERLENLAPHHTTRRGIVLVPEREKVFPHLTVAENLIVPAPRGPSAA